MDYKSAYDRLMLRASGRRLLCYSEKHHIVPKCLGGERVRSNVVRLTAREHFVAHLLLVKIYPMEPRLAKALWYMTQSNRRVEGRDYKINARRFAEARRLAAIAHSVLTRGRPKTEEHKAKISLALKGKQNALGTKRTLAQNRARSIWMRGNKNSLGRVLSEETRKKMSLSQKRRYEA